MQSKAQRIRMIRKAHQNFLRKQQAAEFGDVAPISARSNELHYTDGSQYAEQYYGGVARATTRFDEDWD